MNNYQNNTKRRMSGIIAHPTSFPSNFGIGDLGSGAYDFVDFLVSAGQTLWQVLPLGPTGYGDSPYQSFSAFAGQTLIISPSLLSEDGLLNQTDLEIPTSKYPDQTDYGQVYYYKAILYQKAYNKFLELDAQHPLLTEYTEFCNKHCSWLDDFSLYAAIKDNQDHKEWFKWPSELRTPSETVKLQYSEQLNESIGYYKFLQFIFYRQWAKLKQYANDRGIYIVGDIPIFVALDGSDTWTAQDLFILDEKGIPLKVAGVPPDYFSETGQLWGNPLYNWMRLEETNYHWWIRRIKHQLEITDYLRIDHFRGFEAYWAVPYGEKTAVNGAWEKGPGEAFFKTLQNELGRQFPIFAEDLGVITHEVEKLRDDFHLPGMKVLQFGFEDMSDNHFLPHNYNSNCICYTGTHDNDTTKGWYQSLPAHAKERAMSYMNGTSADIAWEFIRLALSSTAKYAIIPLQDVLGIGSEGRMNTPGKVSGNWKWRFLKTSLNNKLADRMRTMTQLYGR